MENKKVYKIRRKGTDCWLSLGYNNKNSWNVYPAAIIKEHPTIFENKEDFEIHVFEYELKEVRIEKLR